VEFGLANLGLYKLMDSLILGKRTLLSGWLDRLI